MIESICKDWMLFKYKDFIVSSSVWVSNVCVYENSIVIKIIWYIDYL